nr:EOG090X09C5 [Artemia franciscana]
MALYYKVKVHPVVLMQIVDSYERRALDNQRIIGTLLGTIDKDVVEVTSCFHVPHSESEDQVSLEMEFAKGMHELHKKVNSSEVIVGWWATGREVKSQSTPIHEYYALQCSNPIHLVVDTSLTRDRMDIEAFASVPVGVVGKTMGLMFTKIPVDIACTNAETVGLVALEATKHTQRRQAIQPELLTVAETVKLMTHNIMQISKTIEEVYSMKSYPDPALGRHLLGLVNSIPKMNSDSFDSLQNDNIKDLLAIMYLAQLTKSQLNINEKLAMISMQT